MTLNPYFIVVPLLTINLAAYGAVIRRGFVGYLAASVAGCLWAVLLGLAAGWLLPRAPSSGDIDLFLCIAVAGTLCGSGLMYNLLFGAVLAERSVTYDVLSALMKPTVPYYIALNSVMELLLVPLAIVLNWDATPPRRWLIVVAATIYVAQRVWTYLVFAEGRVKSGTSPLSAEDLAWFKRTLAIDYRAWVNIAVFALIAAAAFFARA